MSANSREKIIAVIPAFNESKSIKAVISNVIKVIDILVVDDGSNDATSYIARNEGAFVYTHLKNLGYESAITSGLEEASRLGYKYAITIDADGQHNLEAVKYFLDGISRGYDLILGVRSNRARFSEVIFCFIFKLIWGPRDPLCGMKGYALPLYMKYGPYNHTNSVTTDAIIKMIIHGVKYYEVDVKIEPRVDKSRFGGCLKANYKILKGLFFICTRYFPIKKRED